MASIAKRELAGLFAEKTGLSMAESSRMIETLLECIAESLERGDTVRLTGFGSFRVIDTSERLGHDPRTGAPLTIPPGRRVQFSPGSHLRGLALADARVTVTE